ncbi:MAG: hypothetical protein FWC92_01005 [Defluviitaleaceae bacterium]|nr:hypothetical protein [Defluviitaleaceae bacterium]
MNNGHTKRRALWIAQTAMLIALMVTAQIFTQPYGQFVTGSTVNFILVMACILVGVSSGITVGAISPIIAYMITGRPIFPVLIPFVITGNAALAIVVHFIFAKAYVRTWDFSYVRAVLAVIVGSVAKFLVLWVGIVQVALLFIPNIMPPQVEALSHMFSWPQLVTALIGSTLAMVVAPRLVKAIKTR